MNRAMNAHTPLGPDVLMFSALSGREELSRLFDFVVEFKSTRAGISAKSLLGQSISVDMRVQGGGKRYLNGQCSQFHATGMVGRYYVYEARLRPWLWYASRRSDYKIFQAMSVPEIVLDVLKKYPFPVKTLLSKSYRKWEYNVQYRESDFNYVSRLLEHEGIYYYFEHSLGEHTLVLCDDMSAHGPYPGYAAIPYYAPDSALPDGDYFDTWIVGQTVESGAYATDDYDFKKPATDLALGREKPRPHANAAYEIYDYPGGYTESDEGEHYSRTRMEELQAEHEVIQAFGPVWGAAPGCTFTLERHPDAGQKREYLVTRAHYALRDNSYEADSGQEELDWRVSLEALPRAETYRPARLTPKPHSMGPETAVVVGPAGEEIYTDEYGRVKVQFHWDRYGRKNENSSCWIRVALPWAGEKWGFIHIPRMGQEVLVDFIGGDPDYPIITGSVYNAAQMPPYGLPENKTASGIKSRSSKGADATDYNEIRFEDKKGEEQIYLHAQRNHDNVVELDESQVIGNNRQTRVENNDERYVNNNDTQVIVAEQTITVGGNQTESVALNQTVTVSGNQSLTVGASQSAQIGGDTSLVVDGSGSVAYGGEYSFSVGDMSRYTYVGNATSVYMGDRNTLVIGNDRRGVVGNSSYMTSDYAITAVQSHSTTVGMNRSANIAGNDDTKVLAAQTVSVVGVQSTDVKGARSINVGGVQNTTVKGLYALSAGAVTVTSTAGISMSGGGFIKVEAGGIVTITSAGAVTISAPAIALNAAAVTVAGVLTVAGSIVTPSIISATYTPGVGNMI